MFGAAVLAIVSLFAAVRSQAADGEAKEKAGAKELQGFKGTWRLSSRQVDGKKFSEDEIKDVIATIDKSGAFSVRQGDRVMDAGTVKLDPTTKPKTFEVAFSEGDNKGKKGLGIYEIDGDTFRSCCARPGDARPDEFSATAGSGRTLVVFQREKK
jgi:uncharacterized protein (TIGR03067 family)